MEDFARVYEENTDGTWILEVYKSGLVRWGITVKVRVGVPNGGTVIVNVRESEYKKAFEKATEDLLQWVKDNKIEVEGAIQ